VKAAPQEPNLHFGLGYLHWKMKQYDDAEADFKNELSLDSDNAQAMAFLGDVLLKKDDPGAALLLIKKALQSRKDIRIAYVDLGAILAQQGQNQDAIVALKRAIDLDPEQPDAHFRLGRVYQAVGNHGESQKEFAKVRELHDKAEEDVARKMSAAPPPVQP
jgi:tetratricopeptide (TPR) repeat protein